MKRLEELLVIEDLKERQDAIKKSFMLYTEPVQVDGFEEEGLVILLNLAQSKPTCKNYLDEQRAKSYFASEGNLAKAVGETEWVHTHNLKYPDSRVKDQRIIAPSSDIPVQLGWAHNSGTYPHTIWLLNTFFWQSEETCVLREIVKHTQFWFDLLEKFGLAGRRLDSFVHSIRNNVPESSFPEAVNLYSKQVRFPYQNDYLSITPVVSHGIQQELERLARQGKTGLRFTSVSLPHPASIGNLCGSLGGHMRLLHYPMNVRERSSATLLDSRIRSGKYCDDYQLTNKTICGVLGHLSGNQSQITKVKQAQLRKHQLRILRKQIALWLLPLIELKERYNESSFKLENQDDLVARFISSDITELGNLTKELNQRIHFTLQKNKFSNRYAYHQKLVQPIRTQLEWVLQQLSLSEKEEDLTSSEQYLYLSSLRVQDALAQSNPYLIGVPSLTAIWGFVHQYQLNIEKLSDEKELFVFDSFAIFIRDEHIHRGAKLSEPNQVIAKETITPTKRPTTRTDVYVDLVLDIVIKVQGDSKLSDYDKVLKASLPTRFAGGTIFPPKLDVEAKWLQVFTAKSSLFFSLKGLDCSGSWLSPVEEVPFSLDALGALIAEDQSIVVTANGYKLLESPRHRIGSTTGLHAYAENTLGLAKKVNAVEYRISGRDHFFSSAFWSISVNTQSIQIRKNR